MKSFIVDFWAFVFHQLRWVSAFQLCRALLPSRLITYTFVDAWVLSQLCVAALSLTFWSTYQASCWRYLPIAWAALRVFEVVIYQVNVLFFDAYRAAKMGKPYALRGYRRLVLLTLHNYAEVVVWFALFYRSMASSFSDDQNALQTTAGSIYYSLVTMSTLGYGDIHPNGHSGFALVACHLGVSLFLTLVIVARIISFLPQPATLDDTEQGIGKKPNE